MKEVKEQDNCLRCIHLAMFAETAPINDLQCRRFPPTIHRNDLDELKMYYPTVGDKDWCGEFQRRTRNPKLIK